MLASKHKYPSITLFWPLSFQMHLCYPPYLLMPITKTELGSWSFHIRCVPWTPPASGRRRSSQGLSEPVALLLHSRRALFKLSNSLFSFSLRLVSLLHVSITLASFYYLFPSPIASHKNLTWTLTYFYTTSNSLLPVTSVRVMVLKLMKYIPQLYYRSQVCLG